MDIPVLLMGFNRPDLLTRALESLREQGVQNLYVSLDGPRFEDEIGSCEECFKCVQQYRDSFQLKVLSRSSNLGCYLGVISNIDWFFSQVNFGIIIEDDCVVDEEFFRKAQEYLDTFDKLAERHWETIKETNVQKKKKKFCDYLLRKGWESNLVYDRLKELEL